MDKFIKLKREIEECVYILPEFIARHDDTLGIKKFWIKDITTNRGEFIGNIRIADSETTDIDDKDFDGTMSLWVFPNEIASFIEEEVNQ